MAADWGNGFGEIESRDYKAELVEQERMRQDGSRLGWIYIGVCDRFPGMAKVGLTTGCLGTRASSAQNPFYTLLCAFKVKEGTPSHVFREIESATKSMLETMYRRESHVGSGLLSEWFYADPNQLRGAVSDFLYAKFSWYIHAYYCSDRDLGVIHSWENERLLYGRPANPYLARDLSNPPIALECLMPPGCGEDCGCWS